MYLRKTYLEFLEDPCYEECTGSSEPPPRRGPPASPLVAAHITDIITASQVCRYWRTSFLSYPNLWTYLDCKSDHSMRTFIERSGVAPLDVAISPG